MDVKEKFLTEINTLWESQKTNLIDEAQNHLLSNNINVNFNTKIDSFPNDFGIYLFFFKPKKGFIINNLQNVWELDSGLKYTPKLYPSKFKPDGKKEWHPFYIGKAEKLYNRINEHCFQESNKTTYGLKLIHRKNLLENADISFNYYPIPNPCGKDKAAIQFLMTNLERSLREKLSPWIGKQ